MGHRHRGAAARVLVRRLGGPPTGGDLSGAVADLGILVPLVAALIAVNGLGAGPVLVTVGLTVVVAGLRFGMPWPVQPLKAMTAIAIAQAVSPELLHAGGFLLGVSLLALTASGATDRLARWFTRPVIRSLQLAVGGLLVIAAVRLVATPPALLRPGGATSVDLWLALGTVVVVAVAAARRWYAAAGLLLVAGVGWSLLANGIPAAPTGTGAGWSGLLLPDPRLLPAAFVLLVVPQLPLTFGNAVVGVSDLAREHFPERSARVSPARVATSTGVANVASALVGGLPMCHGSSGFTAHVRLGARTGWMNVLLGSVLVGVGLAVPRQVLGLLTLLPVWALAGFLAYAGLRHALLVADLRGRELVLALVAGLAGLATGNLLVTTVAALGFAHLPRRRHAATRSAPGLAA